jgi:hypothetical protein
MRTFKRVSESGACHVDPSLRSVGFLHRVPKRDSDPERLLRRRRAWGEASAIVIASRVVFFAIALAGAALLNPDEFERPSFLQMWARWDALHYIDIARHGYTGLGIDPNQTAFFPFFPLLIHAISSIGIDAVTAGLLVTGAASLVAASYLYLLAGEDSDAKSADNAGRLAVVYLVTLPTAVYLIAPYSEAVFLAGAIPAFYYARRSEWTKVALPAAIAVGTRVSGVFLLIGLAVEFIRQGRYSQRYVLHAGAALAVAALPLFAYATYLGIAKEDPLDFLHAQGRGWDRSFTSPISALTATWHVFWDGRLGGLSVTAGPRYVWFGELAAAFVGCAGTVWALRRREWGYAAYMGTTMAALIMSGTTFLSLPRMLLALFPIPVLLANWSVDRPLRVYAILFVLLPLTTLGVLIYALGTAWFY